MDWDYPDYNPLSPSDPCYTCPDFADCDGSICRFDCVPIAPNVDYLSEVTGNTLDVSQPARMQLTTDHSRLRGSQHRGRAGSVFHAGRTDVDAMENQRFPTAPY